MNIFPLRITEDASNHADALRYIARERENDVRDWYNLPKKYMTGRKVEKVPTGSADIATTDRKGDFNYTASFLYLCVDNAGTLAWRRVALVSW